MRRRGAQPARLLATTLEEVSKVDMKKQPYLAKERIFKTLHPTFIPRPRTAKTTAKPEAPKKPDGKTDGKPSGKTDEPKKP